MQRIFVGDVQGCFDELEELVDRAREAFGDEFALWIAGDLVNRGPGNLRALELARRFVEAGRGEYILGNHEIALISIGLGLRDPAPNDSIDDVLGAPDAGEWIDWLRARPLVVPGEIEGHPFAMVHAAVDPDWSLEALVEAGRSVSGRLAASRESARALLSPDAAPDAAADAQRDPIRDRLGRLTRCRSLPLEGGWSSEEPGTPDRAWHRVWSSRGHGYGIVYGHWARQGLHMAPGLRGLDTGCVHHGRGRDGLLTAWLPDSAPSTGPGRPFDLPDDRLWQIPARRRYYDPV